MGGYVSIICLAIIFWGYPLTLKAKKDAFFLKAVGTSNLHRYLKYPIFIYGSHESADIVGNGH